MKRSTLSLQLCLHALLGGSYILAQSPDDSMFMGYTELNATSFKTMIDDTTTKWFDVIVDVRTQEEWDEGHIEGATLVEDLALFGTADQGVGTPSLLAGCEYCNIVVYCSTGGRAAQALQVLINASFVGYLYSGLGVTQWQAAGYPLVTDEPVVPPCTVDNNVMEQCRSTYLAYSSGVPVAVPTNTTSTVSNSSDDAPESADSALASFTELNATSFKQMLDDTTTKWFDVIVDVRTQAEWDEGHIEGATLVEDLALFGTADQGVGAPSLLAGCEFCNIVVYCRTGRRSAVALQVLSNASFVGYLYNGLGVSQWQEEGYPLVMNDSVAPPCTVDANVTEQCRSTYLAYTSGGVAVPTNSSSINTTAEPNSTSTSAPSSSNDSQPAALPNPTTADADPPTTPITTPAATTSAATAVSALAARLSQNMAVGLGFVGYLWQL